MTIAAAAAKAGPYMGSDSASAFDFAFKVFADTDIRVVATVIATGVESDLALNTDYTVTRNVDQDNDPGGTVTYKVGGVTTAYPSTHKLTIVGDFVYEQPTDIPNGGSFFASVVETALDRLTLLVKQMKEQLDRAVTVEVSSSTDPAELIDSLVTSSAAAVSAAGTATTQAGIATTQAGIATTAVSTAVNGFKNKIIGGDFGTNPWQRETSFTAPAPAAYTADRWYLAHSSDAVVDIFKTADSPTAEEADTYSTHCLHADVTTADAAMATAQYYLIRQAIEGLNAAAFGLGKAGTRYITLSFWHKHTKTGTYCVSFTNSAANRSYVAEYTQSVSDTWEKSVITLNVDTTGTWLYATDVGLRVSFAIACGATYQTAADAWTTGNYFATANQVNGLDNATNNFKIALVQLEAGSVATPFEARPYGIELALCQRYYYRQSLAAPARIANGYCYSTTKAHLTIHLPTTLRIAIASIEQNGTAGDYGLAYDATGATCTSVPTFLTGSKDTVSIEFTCAAVLTVGHGIVGYAINPTFLGFPAEL